MSEAVEKYAKERAESVAEESVRNFFANGANVELVAASIVGLTRERVQEIYDSMMHENLSKV